MKTTPSRNAFPNSWKIHVTAWIIAGVLLLMFITNPTQKGFVKYLSEYVKTESGSTIAPKEIPLPVNVTRVNYYLYSFYSVNLEGIEHHYLGMFGSFHNY